MLRSASDLIPELEDNNLPRSVGIVRPNDAPITCTPTRCRSAPVTFARRTSHYQVTLLSASAGSSTYHHVAATLSALSRAAKVPALDTGRKMHLTSKLSYACPVQLDGYSRPNDRRIHVSPEHRGIILQSCCVASRLTAPRCSRQDSSSPTLTSQNLLRPRPVSSSDIHLYVLLTPAFLLSTDVIACLPD